MKVDTLDFGLLPNGTVAKLFCFESTNGMKVKITNFGGIITSIELPDKLGKVEEITAGFSSLSEYLKGHPHFGVIVGRYANRIDRGRFRIFGKEYSLPINNGPNHLHGGENGFHSKLWSYELKKSNSHASLSLSYISHHQEEGYPGNLKVTITYNIIDSNEIGIVYLAKTDAHTHVNLTNHCYFNLNGFADTIYDHKLWLNSESFVEINSNQIPTGNFVSCKNSPFDFSVPTNLGISLEEISEGIDHCFAINQPLNFQKPAAILSHRPSGRNLTIYCTQPGIQVYTGNSLDGSLKGHNGKEYTKHSAICLETQHYPDTPNHCNFPTTLLTPGETYFHETRIIFGIA